MRKKEDRERERTLKVGAASALDEASKTLIKAELVCMRMAEEEGERTKGWE
jgi:hypothetical protein